jgi:predicted DNA-binding transcriptional regulator YafY
MHPYDVIDYHGWLYVVGFAPQHNAKRTWKVNRIDARADPMHFQRPGDFRVDEYLAGSFGMYHGDGELRVKIRFCSAAARYVRETNWHPSQQLTAQADGSLLAEFVLSGTQEIKSWIYGFGPDAEVLEPESLRREMAAELEQLRAIYSSAPPGVAARPRSAVTGKGKRRTAHD